MNQNELTKEVISSCLSHVDKTLDGRGYAFVKLDVSVSVNRYMDHLNVTVVTNILGGVCTDNSSILYLC